MLFALFSNTSQYENRLKEKNNNIWGRSENKNFEKGRSGILNIRILFY